MNKKRIVMIVVVILGLIILLGIAVLRFRPSSERILIEGKPVEIGSCSLHPVQSKVEATAWWHHNPYPSELETEWQIYVDVKMVELDVNGAYYFLDAHFQGGGSVFGAGIPYSEGDVLHMVFSRLNYGTFSNGTVVYDFELRDGKIDVVLPFYVKKEKIVEGESFWIDHLKVGEIEFSVEVEGEGPPQL